MRDRRCRLAPPAANADAVVGQQDQRRSDLVIDRAGRIGIDHRDVEQAERRALAAFARPGDLVIFVLPQQRGEFLSGQDRARVPGSTLGKAGAGRAHFAIRIDNGEREARLAERAAQLAIQIGNKLCHQIGRRHRGDGPDEVIVAPARAERSDFPAPALLALDHVDHAFAVAPGSAARLGEAFQAGVVHRQARRSVIGSEPLFVERIGANQPPGPVGHGNRGVGAVNRGDRDRPVRQGIFDFRSLGRTAGQGPDDGAKRA